MIFVFFAVFAYLLGSVNFSIIFFALTKRPDPRGSFSGNPGATNVYRQAGAPAAALVLILDAGRAAAAAAAASLLLGPAGTAWSCTALLLGNTWPCFHGFSGGKGVANYLGFSAVIVPAAAILSCAAWTAVYLVFRKPFLGSFAMAGVLCAAEIIKWRETPLAAAGAAASALLIIFNHRNNIAGIIR